MDRTDEPNTEPPRDVASLCRAVVELRAGDLKETLELAEELHGAVGVWVAQLRREHDHWIRGLHRHL